MPVQIAETPRPRYNIAPTTLVPVLRAARPDPAGGTLLLDSLRWGFKPAWSNGLLLNAQAEKYCGPGRSYWKRGFSRCLFPAAGYYEWQAQPGSRRKQPMMLAWPDGEPLAMAGLWREWGHEPAGVGVILTTVAAPDVAQIHHRMPALLRWEQAAQWLAAAAQASQGGRAAHAATLLQPRSGLHASPVSQRLGKVGEDDPGLLQP